MFDGSLNNGTVLSYQEDARNELRTKEMRKHRLYLQRSENQSHFFSKNEPFSEYFPKKCAKIWKSIENLGQWYFQTFWVQVLSLILTVLSCILYVLFTYLYSEGKKCSNFPVCDSKAQNAEEAAEIIKNIQIAITFTFAIDFGMALVIAPSIIRYLFSFQGFVDVISLLPLLDLLNDEFYALSFTRFLRLTKAFRILRQQMIGKYSMLGMDDLRFNVFLLGIKLTGIFFITSSLIYALNEFEHGFGPKDGNACSFEPEQNNPICFWHDAFYASVVTLTTVGYGDIYANSDIARLAIIIIIFGSFIIIPYEVSQLADAFTNMPVYKKGYSLEGQALHLILTTPAAENQENACFEAESLRRMIEDLLHENHGIKAKNLFLVIMAPSLPSSGIKNILRSARFRRKVSYYRGSIHSPQDLAAVKAQYADCIMIMLQRSVDFDDEASNANSEQTMMSLIALQRFMGRIAPDPSILENVHNLQSSTGREKGTQIIVVADQERDLEVLKRCKIDVIVNREALKMGMLAQATLAPAFLCFATNCLRVAGTDPSRADSLKSHFFMKHKRKEDSSTKSDENDSISWLKGYLSGASYEMYTMELKIHEKSWLNNRNFIEAATLLYFISQGKVVLLGMMDEGRSSGASTHKHNSEGKRNVEAKKVAIAPSFLTFHFVSESSKISVFILATSWKFARNFLNRFIHLSENDGDAYMNRYIEKFSHSSSSLEMIAPNLTREDSIYDDIIVHDVKDLEEEVNSEISVPSPSSKSSGWSGVHQHVKSATKMLESMFENINHSSFSSNPSYEKWDDYKARIRMVKNSLRASLLVRAPELPMNLSNHIVIIAENQEWLKRYVIPLRRRSPFVPLVLVAPNSEIYTNLLKDLAKEKEIEKNLNVGGIFYVHGNGKNINVIERSLVERATSAVLLNDGNDDSNVLYASFSLERFLLRKGVNLRVLADVRHERNIYFLRQRTDHVSLSGPMHSTRTNESFVSQQNGKAANVMTALRERLSHKFEIALEPITDSMYMWPIYASGGVWTESVLNTFCTQVYYNAHLLEFWEALCLVQRIGPREENEFQSSERNVRNGQFQQVMLTGRKFKGEKYCDLAFFLFQNGCIPLGLYRPPSHYKAPLFYTHVNPPMNEPLVIGNFSVNVRDTISSCNPMAHCDRAFFLRGPNSLIPENIVAI
mmetsp:Transcript_4946/g.7469  ORF Transcript_4946/g.7469 Transcript_4946/m.7469 type:complete len:1173 (+) Transcript_4946:15-3533(+)